MLHNGVPLAAIVSRRADIPSPSSEICEEFIHQGFSEMHQNVNGHSSFWNIFHNLQPDTAPSLCGFRWRGLDILRRPTLLAGGSSIARSAYRLISFVIRELSCPPIHQLSFFREEPFAFAQELWPSFLTSIWAWPSSSPWPLGPLNFHWWTGSLWSSISSLALLPFLSHRICLCVHQFLDFLSVNR